MINSSSRGKLDQIAIALALVCGIHCLITPILLVALPFLATTFWTSSNFHLWMFCFVLPTTALASILGYRRHKNKSVAALTIVGVALLAIATLWERTSLSENLDVVAHRSDSPLTAGESCGSCCVVPSHKNDSLPLSLAGITLSTPILFNLLGGLFLIRGHWRNFRLCRTDHNCSR